MLVLIFVLLANVWFSAVLCGHTTKTRMLSIKDCETPDFPVDAHPLPHTFSIHAVRGVNYVRTNFTIERATPPISISLRGYRVVNKARRLDFRMDRVNCRHPVLGAVLDSFHVRYHRHNCTGIPGDYGSDRFNLDDIAKTFNFYNVFSLGTYIIEMEYITSKNTCIMCYALTLVLWK
ncbi:uncharacterized protein LOC105392221 isoform X2 [Plutella xylostella]|uniref:uncharacterized protein LOC105392221 isoform X2 n=1 Tax=Plutella xylostella TaxID=51655 RepID=UPI0018D13619|nr:uncharacterized protein LOC105392221 isoform X2 [Plutella xylostella]